MRRTEAKLRVFVVGLALGKFAAGFQCVFESPLQPEIGLELLIGDPVLVMNEELRLKHMQAGEFLEQESRGIGNRAHGIAGVQPLPPFKCAVGVLELKVIHLAVAVFQRDLGLARRRGR